MYNATVAVFKLFKKYDWEVPDEVFLTVLQDRQTFSLSLLNLRRNYHCKIRKYKHDKEVKGNIVPDYWIMAPCEEPDWYREGGEYIVDDHERLSGFAAPCGRYLRTMTICTHGKKCANAWRCPVAYEVPTYQAVKDQRSERRDALRQAGYTGAWQQINT